jgi:adenosylhomocysteine nucleosidase
MTWLLVAAEPREFAGILRRARRVEALDWPGVRLAREIDWRGSRWLLAANGPGPALAARVLADRRDCQGLMSVGFCGALDPALRIGDIVVSGDSCGTGGARCVRGEILSLDRVVVTREEKHRLRETTGASAVEMESAAVAAKAGEWGLRFCCVRSVSDTAHEDMPLDFNRYRDRDGRFSRPRIAAAALARPLTIPGLLRLDRNCRAAAESLGEFLAECQV